MDDVLHCYLIEDDDSLVPVPAARFERVRSGQGRAGRYAGRRIRAAAVRVSGTRRAPEECYFVLEFDAVGKVDQTRQDEEPRPPAVVRREGNVIEAGARFARRGRASGWKPTAQLRKRILEHAHGWARPAR